MAYNGIKRILVVNHLLTCEAAMPTGPVNVRRRSQLFANSDEVTRENNKKGCDNFDEE